MDLGDYALRAGTGTLAGAEARLLLAEAVVQYGEAYALHPRNPDAAQALERALAALGAQLETATPEERAEAHRGLESLLERHPELAQHPALADLIDDLD
jgi:hypothetical protein